MNETTDATFVPKSPSSPIRGLIWMCTVLFTLSVTSPVFAAVDSYVVGVDGMACPFCAYGIEKKLRGLDGVESLEIRIKDGEVDVTVAEGGTVTPKHLDEAVKEAGFAIGHLSVTGEATVEQQSGTTRVTFSDTLSLTASSYKGETGTFEVRGKLTRPDDDGDWRLEKLERLD